MADISQSSTKTVAQLTNPGARGIRKKGLVLGYVQSGKTANYAALIAKAADEVRAAAAEAAIATAEKMIRDRMSDAAQASLVQEGAADLKRKFG